MTEFLKEILGEYYSEELESKIFSKIDESYVDKKTNKLEQEKIEKAHKDEIKQIRLQNAIESALSICGAKNKKAVSALLDQEQIEVDENGVISGLENQIASLKQSDSFLFENKKISGLEPAEKVETNFKSPKEMSYSELCDYLATKNNFKNV